MHSEFSKKYKAQEQKITHFVENFSSMGEEYGNQKRNSLRLFDLDGEKINIKSFKVPNIINKIAYKYVRKSKAQRSFEYAHKLLDMGIKTPEPVAYFQQDSKLFFGKSYYVSKHLNYDLTYRELIHDVNFPNRYDLLIHFTKFTYELHEKGIEFLDHSPGNTLVIINRMHDYDFYLVDLNRMNFHDEMSYEMRINNFARLTPDKNMVQVMAAEYAKLINEDFHKVFLDMWNVTEEFFESRKKKNKMKEKIKFWKK